MVTSPTSPNKSWRASTKTVPVRCQTCKDVRGVAAANAVSDKTPHKFRALCPTCEQPLVTVKK